jgi:hypothetical protein
VKNDGVVLLSYDQLGCLGAADRSQRRKMINIACSGELKSAKYCEFGCISKDVTLCGLKCILCCTRIAQCRSIHIDVILVSFLSGRIWDTQIDL